MAAAGEQEEARLEPLAQPIAALEDRALLAFERLELLLVGGGAVEAAMPSSR